MNNERPVIYAVDFDGTLCQNAWPEIGEPNQNVINCVQEIQEQGGKWILWTMREGAKLAEAEAWCCQHGLFPDAINDNLPELKKAFNNNPRKVFANYYIDDHNAGGLIFPPSPKEIRDKAYNESGYAPHMVKFNSAAQILNSLLGDLQKEGEITLKKYVEDFIEGVGYASLEIDQLVHPEYYHEDINDL